MPYSAAMLLLSSLASLPLSYLSGYVIEHRYNLSNQSLRSWLTDQLKGLGVSLVLALPLAQGAYAIIRRYPKRWWAILSGLTIPVTVVLVNLAPVLLLPIFNRFEPLKDRSLAKRLQDLAGAQGVHVSNVMQMDMSKQTKKANAFFTGLGNTKRIVLGDTLLGEFTPDEVEVVLAHELSHQVHRDLWKGIAVGALSSLVTFFSVHRFAQPLIQRWGRRWGLRPESGPADVAALPLLGLVASVVSLVLGPILNGLTRATIEHPADRYALDLTGKRNAFISAMQKLGRMNLSDPHPPAIIKYLLYDHPPIHERIEFARGYKNQGNR
jgi:STE24 endopeptidase